MEKKCGACKGTGLKSSEERCPECEGYGKPDREEDKREEKISFDLKNVLTVNQDFEINIYCRCGTPLEFNYDQVTRTLFIEPHSDTGCE